MNTVVISRTISAPTQYKHLFEVALDHMARVLASKNFRIALEDEIAHSKNLEGELSSWRREPAQRIYENLFDRTTGVATIRLFIQTYWSPFSSVGYGYPHDNITRVNTKWLSRWNGPIKPGAPGPMYLGSLLLHEHGHEVGYDHDYAVTERRPNSICYVLNRAYERAYKELYWMKDVPPITDSWEQPHKRRWWQRLLTFWR